MGRMNRVVAVMAFTVSIPFGIALASTPKQFVETVSGTASAPVAGQCTQGFSNQCPSGDTCECVTVSNANAKGGEVGKVTGVSNFDITIDTSIGTKDDTDFTCNPVFVTFELEGTKDTQTINSVGALCKSLSNHQIEIIGGGFSIASSLGTQIGNGLFHGTANLATQKLVIKLTGTQESD